MEAFVNGQNLPTEFDSKLRPLWVLCLNFWFKARFASALKSA